MTSIMLQWEVNQKEFDEKFTYEYLDSLMPEKEKLDLMVVSEDEETVTKMHYYKSKNGQIYVTKPVVYQNALNLLSKKEITNESDKSLQRSS